MTYAQLWQLIQQKKSYLCVGLDPDLKKIPSSIQQDPDALFSFNRTIIDATREFAVAYKPNFAFYEAYGKSGWEALQKTMAYIGSSHFIIADAKRGDIGNTASLYAQAILDELNADCITVAPYMGKDSITPFLAREKKWVAVLALTSNEGSEDFQLQKLQNGLYLFESVMQKTMTWASKEQLMFVVGATHNEPLKRVRLHAPENFLLVPGVGAQGGSLATVSQQLFHSSCGLLVNSSRAILYADSSSHFGEAAFDEAHKIQKEMNTYLERWL